MINISFETPIVSPFVAQTSPPKSTATTAAEAMICMNATTSADSSNDSSVSGGYSSSISMPTSSPVKSLAIKQLLESPLIKAPVAVVQSSSTTSSSSAAPSESLSTTSSAPVVMSSQTSVESSDDTDLDTNPELNAVLVAESPEPSPQSTLEDVNNEATDGVTEVADSQSSQSSVTSMTTAAAEDDSNDTTSGGSIGGRNCLRRQTSMCVNTSMSSPRALAILKNAIKTSYNNNSNKFCDKMVVNSNNMNGGEDVTNKGVVESNGCQSPPNHKLIRNSPFSRGSVYLKAVKERFETQRADRSPKVVNDLSIELSIDSSFDRQLKGIIRKHELQSSPTSSGEPKAKKKKVLFAEPVVSSKLEFKLLSPSPTSSPSISGVQSLSQQLFPQQARQSIICEGPDSNDKRRNSLVHQNSTFDKEFDTNSVDSSDSASSDSPLLMTQKFFADDLDPTCSQYPTTIISDFDDNSDMNLRNAMISSTNDSQQDSQSSSEDMFMCSQPMPESLGVQLVDIGVQTIPISESADTFVEDPVLNVPMRLSLIKELFNMFGNVLDQYSES
ncbi:unnamed protein product [Oppiella nova]|uniref:Uncharacterized protein n=1 Tax=Oppiella nova TaxID=334625 RepID=A0A7R9LPF9_9ACAR|nr:unnamed protein product [Oppiella nova]CAG2165298.1 unnamed protein product [Oppiella nova]